MKILVTGGTGFIGRALIKRLLREGHAMTALTRDPQAARNQLPAEVETRLWNPEKPESMILPEGFSTVIHLAGAGIAQWPWNQKHKDRLWTSRVDTTRKLVEALGRLRNKPEALISVSGMGYYGDAGNREVHAGDAPGMDFLGRLAAAWENEACAARHLGMRVAIPRLGMVLGRDGGALPRMAWPFRFGCGATLGSGKQYWPWIHLDDTVDLFLQAVTHSEYDGLFHAVAGEPVTQGEFARTLALVLRRPLFFRLPEFAIRLALSEMADLFLHGQCAMGDAPGFQPRYPRLAEALRAAL